ncbi:hypothetical protein FDP41_008601 [Naegleria fowleri]|nr:uncharacterized protein FDP41_008601 [Naegleria fowleri]KAF0973097.1 hypothetical protein FDP41_008601 [Naegleria fowleri]
MNSSSNSLFIEQAHPNLQQQQQQRIPYRHHNPIIISEQDRPSVEEQHDEPTNPKRFSVASVTSSVDFESSIQLKPSIFSISVDLFIITCSLGLAIWGLVYFTKYINLPKARVGNNYFSDHMEATVVNNLLNNIKQFLEKPQEYLSLLHSIRWTVFENQALKNTFNTSSTASCNFSDLNSLVFNIVVVVSVSDLIATILSIASVALVLIALVNAGRKLF